MAEPELAPGEEQILYDLGLMIREAGHVEMMLRLVTSTLTQSPQGDLIMAGEDVSRMLELCKHLADGHPWLRRSQCEQLGTVISECKVAFQARNQYVHGAWGQNGGVEQALITMRSRRYRRAPQTEALTATDLRTLSTKFNRLSLELFNLLGQIFERRDEILKRLNNDS
ncbi:hypothetical protein OG729_18530 [Streptomyces sp. NBC_00210]|uniref:hypothetical protein n=1 Tax=Streptomyces sp. NBC_00210 TaxID=2903636 RepID=UPI00324DEB3C